ncbi:AN1-type zinc finger protein 3 isoform X2 [Ascaphus truei]|uniref:AN1-type zinc finger protein 3 isoform X2 n=1 Tax=Ascaphus truei TaxID=8439 RepID=UPI003F59FCE7
MGDAGSEQSKPPSLPPRCPCGFWGSSKTMNLCSQCFAGKPEWEDAELGEEKQMLAGDPHSPGTPQPPTEATQTSSPSAARLRLPASSPSKANTGPDVEKKQPDEDAVPSTSSSQSDLFPSETNGDNDNTSKPTPTVNPAQQLSTDLNVPSSISEECGPCTDTAHNALTTPTKRSCDSDSQSEDDASPMKRPRLLDSGDRLDGSSRSKQKSRRRCFRCQIKLELVQQELGSCRCGYVFCMLHRLPEQHDCTFDHMGRGREEAIMKMVKLDRKVGRSCQRIGEGCS